MRGAVPPPPSTSSWRGAWLSTGTILPLLHKEEFLSVSRAMT